VHGVQRGSGIGMASALKCNENQEFTRMAHIIDKAKCVGCGSCVETCPVEAIKKDGDKYMIDAEACVDCGACEGVCPTEAISAG
jgi:NAD-dependent dihydropyrimidine dehydrogenase PreA subunit